MEKDDSSKMARVNNEKHKTDWWVGFVREKDDSSKMARVNFLHPRGPARSFVYPSQPDILDVPYSDVLCEHSYRAYLHHDQELPGQSIQHLKIKNLA